MSAMNVSRLRSNGNAGRVACYLIAAICLVCASGCMAATPSAVASKTIYLSESGRLRLISKRGFTLYERGSAVGTVSGTIYVRLTAVSSTRVVAEVSISRRGGSISARGSGAYHRGGSQASFSGLMSIVGGSGAYSRARGLGLAFSGTIQQSNNAIAVRVSGRVSA